MSAEREAVERGVRGHCDSGDYDAAATTVVREYGPEILGVLAARLRSHSDASEVFSMFCEDLWNGLAGFEWRCTVRVWAYTLARNAANRYVTAPHRKPGRNLPFSEAGELERAVEQVRTTTLAHLRTENKSRMRDLRETLSGADQELIILRIDKAMSWRDMAIVTAEVEQGAAEEELTRAAARLRKRFQLAKDRLRRLAEAEGLVQSQT